MNTKNVFRYTLADIAVLVGKSIETVRDHKRAGRLHPEDLTSVAKYIVACWLTDESRGKK